MVDYKAMYFRLFNAVTDTIEFLSITQQQCESTYIEADDTEQEGD